MVDLKTTTSSLTSVQTAYNRFAYFQFQPQQYFNQFCDVKWYSGADDPMPGSAVKFTVYSNLAAATTTIDESTDIDSVALSDTQVTVTLSEYGNVATTTEKLRETSFLNVEVDKAQIIGHNMGQSADLIARNTFEAGSNVIYSDATATQANAARTDLLAADVLEARDVEQAVARLKNANTPTMDGAHYVGMIHPFVAKDFKGATGSGTWRAPKEYADTNSLYTGEMGLWAGVRWVETSNAPLFSDGGSGTIDAFGTLIIGKQAWAKGIGVDYEVRLGPVTDKLKRFRPIGWYGLVGYGVMRQNSMWRIESASSMGTNT